MNVRVHVDIKDFERLGLRLKELQRNVARKIVRQSMREATKPVHQAMRSEIRALARKGRGNTRSKGTQSLARIIAQRLKLRALKRSRKRVGFQILIAATSSDIESARQGGPARFMKRPWYAPAHIHWGHQVRGGRRIVGGARVGRKVRQVPFMRRVSKRMERRWLNDFGKRAFDRVAKELAKK